MTTWVAYSESESRSNLHNYCIKSFSYEIKHGTLRSCVEKSFHVTGAKTCILILTVKISMLICGTGLVFVMHRCAKVV